MFGSDPPGMCPEKFSSAHFALPLLAFFPYFFTRTGFQIRQRWRQRVLYDIWFILICRMGLLCFVEKFFSSVLVCLFQI